MIRFHVIDDANNVHTQVSPTNLSVGKSVNIKFTLSQAPSGYVSISISCPVELECSRSVIKLTSSNWDSGVNVVVKAPMSLRSSLLNTYKIGYKVHSKRGVSGKYYYHEGNIDSSFPEFSDSSYWVEVENIVSSSFKVHKNSDYLQNAIHMEGYQVGNNEEYRFNVSGASYLRLKVDGNILIDYNSVSKSENIFLDNNRHTFELDAINPNNGKDMVLVKFPNNNDYISLNQYLLIPSYDTTINSDINNEISLKLVSGDIISYGDPSFTESNPTSTIKLSLSEPPSYDFTFAVYCGPHCSSDMNPYTFTTTDYTDKNINLQLRQTTEYVNKEYKLELIPIVRSKGISFTIYRLLGSKIVTKIKPDFSDNTKWVLHETAVKEDKDISDVKFYNGLPNTIYAANIETNFFNGREGNYIIKYDVSDSDRFLLYIDNELILYCYEGKTCVKEVNRHINTGYFNLRIVSYNETKINFPLSGICADDNNVNLFSYTNSIRNIDCNYFNKQPNVKVRMNHVVDYNISVTSFTDFSVSSSITDTLQFQLNKNIVSDFDMNFKCTKGIICDPKQISFNAASGTDIPVFGYISVRKTQDINQYISPNEYIIPSITTSTTSKIIQRSYRFNGNEYSFIHGVPAIASSNWVLVGQYNVNEIETNSLTFPSGGSNYYVVATLISGMYYSSCSGYYKFYLTCVKSCALFIDNHLVINLFGYHDSEINRDIFLYLEEGYHQINVWYNADTLFHSLILELESDICGIPKQVYSESINYNVKEGILLFRPKPIAENMDDVSTSKVTVKASMRSTKINEGSSITVKLALVNSNLLHFKVIISLQVGQHLTCDMNELIYDKTTSEHNVVISYTEDKIVNSLNDSFLCIDVENNNKLYIEEYGTVDFTPFGFDSKPILEDPRWVKINEYFYNSFNLNYPDSSLNEAGRLYHIVTFLKIEEESNVAISLQCRSNCEINVNGLISIESYGNSGMTTKRSSGYLSVGYHKIDILYNYAKGSEGFIEVKYRYSSSVMFMNLLNIVSSRDPSFGYANALILPLKLVDNDKIIISGSSNNNNNILDKVNNKIYRYNYNLNDVENDIEMEMDIPEVFKCSKNKIELNKNIKNEEISFELKDENMLYLNVDNLRIIHNIPQLLSGSLLLEYYLMKMSISNKFDFSNVNDYYRVYKDKSIVDSNGDLILIDYNKNDNNKQLPNLIIKKRIGVKFSGYISNNCNNNNILKLVSDNECEILIDNAVVFTCEYGYCNNEISLNIEKGVHKIEIKMIISENENYKMKLSKKSDSCISNEVYYENPYYKDIIIEKPNDYILKVNSNLSNAEYIISDSKNFVMRYPEENTLIFTTKTKPYYNLNIKKTIPNTINVTSEESNDGGNSGSDFSSVLKVIDDRVSGIQRIELNYEKENGVIIDYYECQNNIKYSGNLEDIRFSDVSKWNKRGRSEFIESDLEISKSVNDISNYGVSVYSILKISTSGLYKLYLECSSWCILLIDLNNVLRVFNSVEESMMEMNLESGNHYIEVRLISLNNGYNIKVSYESVSNGISKSVINKSILSTVDPVYKEVRLNGIEYQTIPYITTNINSIINLNNNDEIRVDINTNYAADPDLVIKMKSEDYIELSKNEIIYDIINFGEIQSYTMKFKYPNSILIPFKNNGIISYEISPEIYCSSILNDINVNLIKPNYDKSGKENETIEYSFVLSEKPSKDVRIKIECNDVERILCDSNEHVFNTTNYNEIYKVNMKLLNDNKVNENMIMSYDIRVKMESDDVNYKSMNVDPLHISIEDINKAEIKYESDCTNALIEGENCSYSFYLASIPSSKVEIIFSDNGGNILPLVFNEDKISFDNDNWNIKQSVMISSEIDNKKTGDISNIINFEIKSDDNNYKLLSIASHSITMKDKDIPNVVMTTNCHSNIKEGEKCELNYRLTTIPSSSVEIKVSIENCIYNEVNIGSSIIIISSEWNVNKKIELEVNHNYIDTINEMIIIKQTINTLDNDYKVINIPNVELRIENIDKSGIEIRRGCENEIKEGEKCVIFYKLKSKPTSVVEISINMINENEKVKLKSSQNSINIMENGWNNEYSIEYESKHDNIQYENSKVTIIYTITSSDSNYNSISLENDEIIINNIDVASVDIKTHFPIPFYETLKGIMRISLGCKPETDYIIRIEVSDNRISTSKSTIVFDDSNWNKTMEIEIIPPVSLLSDGNSEDYYISYQTDGDLVFKSIVLYPNEMRIYDLIATLIVENKIFDYIKEGDKGEIYYYLSERPGNSVDVYIKCPSTMECKIEDNMNMNVNVNELKIRFNPINYHNKVRMTISIYEDVIARGNYSEEIRYELVSEDEVYNNQEIIGTVISIFDPTIPSIDVISHLPSPFYENSNGDINVILNSKPNDLIRLYYICSSNIKCSSNNNNNNNEDGLIIIKPEEWFIPKVINIKSENDNEVENENENGSIRFISQSNDMLYNNLKINEFVFEIVENDKAELILSKNLLQLYTNTNTNSDNNNIVDYKVTFSLKLSTKPSDDVEIQFNYDETIILLSESSILFNGNDYNIEKEIEIKYICESFQVFPFDRTIGFRINTNDINYKNVIVPTLKLIIKNEIISDITKPPKMILAKLEESDDIIRLEFDNDCYVKDMGKYRKYDCNGLFSNKTMLLLGLNSSCEWISNREMNIYIGNVKYNNEINENSMIELNEDGNRGIRGSENSILYASGKIVISLRESVPKMLSSQFSASGVSIQVYFDRDIYVNELNNNGSVDCSLLFVNDNLGYGCYSQLSSKNSIRITLGISSTILPVSLSINNNNNNCNKNNSLYLIDNMIKSTSSSKYGSNGCINVLLPNELPIPYPVISGFTSISYCSDIVFDGRLTTQTAGRDGEMIWYLENITNIDESENGMKIMDERISKIIDDCNEIHCKIINIPSYTLSPGYYKLSLKVKNFLNPICNTTSHYFHIKAIGIPEISFEGSLIREIPNNEDIYLTVRGYWPDCYETEKNDFRFIWDIYNVNDNNININNFLTNDNKTLYIKAFSLEIDVYYITATTYIEGNPSIKSNITMELNIIAKKLSCIIKDGNREVGSDNRLILNGSLSVDPSDPSNKYGELNYVWKCSNYKTGKNCPSSIISPQSPIWYIPSGILTIGEVYIFELTISKEAFKMTRISKDIAKITIVEGQPPDIHLSTSKEYILPTESYEITAVIEPSRIDDKLIWSLIESDKSFDDIFILPSNNENVIMIKPNSLTRGYKYELKCVVMSKYGNSSNTIELLVHNGPSSGYIIVDNRNGTELKTLFTLSSDGWNSDLPSNSYSYKFAYIYKNEEISLQSDFSSSNKISVYLPYGDSEIIVYVKDVHGYISKGVLDINGEKVIIHVNKDENMTKEKIDEFIKKNLDDEKYRSNFDHIISQVITISQSNSNECDRIRCVNGKCVNGKCVCNDDYSGELCDIPGSINGGWSEWSEWSKCSSSCGGGISYKYRKCNNPKPLYGGLDCVGNEYESVVCNDIPCGDKKINGGWSEWSEWSLCNYECKSDDYGYHEGYEERRRSCTNPSPSINGDMCIGDEIERRNCSVVCDNKVKLCPNEYRDKSGRIYGKACSGHGKCYYSTQNKDNDDDNDNDKCNEGEKGCFTYCKCEDNYDGERCNLVKDELKDRKDLNHKLLVYIQQGISNIILKNELYYQLISSFKIFVEEASEIYNEDLRVILRILSDNMKLLSKSNEIIEKNNIKSLFDIENKIYMEFYRSEIENIPKEIEYLNDMFKEIEKQMYIQYYPSEAAMEYKNELFSYYFYKEKSNPHEKHQINSLSVSLPKSYSYNNNYRSVQLIDWILNPFVSNEQLNSSIVSISLLSNENENGNKLSSIKTSKTDSENDNKYSLNNVITFTIKIPSQSDSRNYECVYFDPISKEYRSKGVILMGIYKDKANDTYIMCMSLHLTEFGSRQTKYVPSINLVNPIKDANLLGNYDVKSMFVPIILGILLLFFILMWFYLHNKDCEAYEIFADKQYEMFAKTGRIDDLPPEKSPIDESSISVFFSQLKSEHTWIGPIIAPNENIILVSRAERCVCIFAILLTDIAVLAMFHGTRTESVTLIFTTGIISALISLPASVLIPHCFMFANKFSSGTIKDFNIFKRFTKVKKSIENSLLFKHENDDANESKKLRIRFHIMISTFILSFIYIVSVIVGFFSFGIDGLGFMLFIINIIYTIHAICGVKLGSSDFLRSFKIFLCSTVLLLLIEIVFLGILFSFCNENSGENVWSAGYKIMKPVIKDIESYGECCGYLSIDRYAVHDCMNPNLLATGYNPINCMNTVSKLLKEYSPLLCIWFISSIVLNIYLIILCVKFLRLPVYVVKEDKLTVKKISEEQRHAAHKIQGCLLKVVAKKNAIRREEYKKWYRQRKDRKALTILVYSFAIVYCIFMMYLNLLYGVKFGKSQSVGWIIACVVTILIDVFIQQPIFILCKSVAGTTIIRIISMATHV